jgi:DNA-binding MarR family transcriptional regulator
VDRQRRSISAQEGGRLCGAVAIPVFCGPVFRCDRGRGVALSAKAVSGGGRKPRGVVPRFVTTGPVRTQATGALPAAPGDAGGGAIHPLRDKPGYLVRCVHQRSTAIFAEESREFGVTGPQHVVMVALAHNPGIDQNTLAELADLDRYTAGDVLSRLVGRGLVIREVNAADRRGRILSLSAQGMAMLQEMREAVARTQERFLAPLSAGERQVFIELLRKMLPREDEGSGRG